MATNSVLVILAVMCSAFYLWVLAEMLHVRKAATLPRLNGITSSPVLRNVTVVIAGRNEARSLGKSLQSILAQESVRQVVFVDDHSSDDTRTVAETIAQDDARLVVLSAPQLAPGWVGKSHALSYGAELVRTKYLLFTDADVWLASGTVEAAAAVMEHGRLDHLGGDFFIQSCAISEEICAPVLAVSSSIALFTTAPRLGAATGAFNMLRADFYRSIGGHNPIKSAIVDDISLARYVKRAGGKTLFVHMSAAVRVRLFNGFRGFVAAVARSAVPFLRLGKVVPLVAAIALMVVGLTTTAMPWLAFKALQANSLIGSVSLAASGVAAYGLGLACIFQSRRYHNGRIGWGLLYPVPIILLALCTACAAISGLLGGKVRWRGRDYEQA
ncbi:MAG: hypothetical protein PCFJNLEI_01619 [Verrucomicrobiae bacterium]|nr:hypothetical protein [Verrucomicrobiae bacterium]